MVHPTVLPTTTLTAEKGVFTTYASCTIDAAPEDVWRVVSDVSTYPCWNHYTPTVTPAQGKDRLEVGDICDFAYSMEGEPDKASSMQMEVLEVDDEQRRIAWRGITRGVPKMLLHPEKVQRVTEVGVQQGDAGSTTATTTTTGRTLFELWETFTGPLSHVVKWTVGGKLDHMGQGIADALKEFVERGKQQDVT